MKMRNVSHYYTMTDLLFCSLSEDTNIQIKKEPQYQMPDFTGATYQDLRNYVVKKVDKKHFFNSM